MKTRHRILVVDDHIDTLELVEMTLVEKYDVLVLQSALDVYEILGLFEPDLIILDIMMPKVTGFQILEIMQKNPAHSRIPIMVLSAKDSTHEIKHGYKLGAKLYLTKPFQPERLKKNVDFLLEQFAGPPRAKSFTPDQIDKKLRTLKSHKIGLASISGSLSYREASKHREAEEEKKRKQEIEDKLRDQWID